MQKGSDKKQLRPPQHQKRPGLEKRMKPQPVFDYPEIKGNNKLKDKIAFITGVDSGIGRAVAILFAKEGASIAISYLNETKDAKETKRIIEKVYNGACYLIRGDISKEKNCIGAVKEVVRQYGRIDILVNNAALHYENKDLATITTRELLKTFE